MKRILVIVLCCVAAFASILFFGCSNKDSYKDQIPSDITNNDNIINDDLDMPYENGSGDVDKKNKNELDLVLSENKIQAKTTIKIRAQASVDAEVLGLLHNFETLPLISKINDNWHQVFYNQKTAYISANPSYTRIVKWRNFTPYLVSGMQVQALTTVNIRAQASTESEVLGKLNRLQHLPLIEKFSQNWYKVLYQGQEAYISANGDYTRVYDPEKASAQIESVIAEGKKALGVPYEYGAQRLLFHNGKPNPNFTGKTFDCSSFVQYSFYMGAQIKLRADSRSQSKEGILINESELERGDLIFMWSSARRYKTGIERIGHVVIYIGDNKILHTWGAGGVRIQDYSAGWRERFILARRML
jgi:cell wall-associated NlpC family hydrolase